jgi:phage terminase small subunit
MAKLTDKQQLFVAFYCETWNATEAARRAGYPERSAYAVGAENLRKPQIRALVDEYKAAIMPAGEVISRLAEHARGTMEDFIDVDREQLDLGKARTAGKLHLIKKFTRTETKYGTNVSVELYDAQAALVHLGKHHGLFTDKVEHSGPDGGDIPVKILRGVSMDEL